MAEQMNGAVVESDAEGIRSALGAAFEAAEKSAAEQETPKPAAAAEETGTAPAEEPEAKEAKPAPGRGPDGKFVKAEAVAEEAEKPEGEKEAAEAKEPAAEKAADLPAEFQKTLSGWKPADQAMFKKQSPEAQAFLMRRHGEMVTDYTKKLQGVSRLKTEYDPVDQMLAPYREQMKQKGFTPHSLIEAWANVEKQLISPGDAPVNVVAGIVRAYNIDRAKLLTALGVPQPQRQRQNGEAVPTNGATAPIQLPPEIAARLSELDTLKQQVSGLTSAQQNTINAARAAAEQRAESEATKFRSAADASGNLLHPYVDEVESDMLALAQAHARSQQPVPPIEELYERAVWANPSTRQKLLTAREQAEDKKRADQARAKAKAAKNAGVSVTGAPGTSQASPVRNAPERSLREELEENFANAAP